MATVQEIINYVDRKFPNQEILENKISDLNKIHSELFVRLKRLSNTYSVDTSVSSVADQAEYNFPTGVQIEDVIKLEVETSDGSGEYEEYDYAGINDEIEYRKVYMRGTASTSYYIYDDEDALGDAGRTIRIYYHVRPTTLTSSNLSVTPNLDEVYHPLLMYGLIVELASQGNNPYRDVANYYQQKYDEFYQDVLRDIEDRAVDSGRVRRKEIEEWW